MTEITTPEALDLAALRQGIGLAIFDLSRGRTESAVVADLRALLTGQEAVLLADPDALAKAKAEVWDECCDQFAPITTTVPVRLRNPYRALLAGAR